METAKTLPQPFAAENSAVAPRRKTFATVCSGVEACSLALDGLDWQPVFFSEIEPFPCAVLAAHYPTVPNLGDISKISYDATQKVITNGQTKIGFGDRLDLLAGGTPCQDFSVSGKRAGGERGSGTRSSLCWEWLRLVAELRPRTILWENVVGCLSTNGGEDFRSLVDAVQGLGYCVAWRILDCQHSRVDKFPRAVPQRRRRVWLVGCLDAEPAELAEVLFERRSALGDSPPRRIARTGTSGNAGAGNRFDAEILGEAIALNAQGILKNRGPGQEHLIRTETMKNVSYALLTAQHHAVAAEAFDAIRSRPPQNNGNLSPTLTAFAGTGGNNVPFCVGGYGRLNLSVSENCSTALTSANMDDGIISRRSGDGFLFVRNFTPTECERLMGFPDDYTVPAFAEITPELVRKFVEIFSAWSAMTAPNAKPKTEKQVRAWLTKISRAETCPLAPRYKVCGNSWAVNCARWILIRIDKFLSQKK